MLRVQYAFGLLISILLIHSVPSQSAVSSIDLGSEWVKVAVVNLKPGQTPISIAINEMSKRKSPVLVAFHGGNRLIGEEAAGLVARYPEKVLSNVRDLIGKPFSYGKEMLDSMYLPFTVVEDSRGAAIKVDENGGSEYSPEELTAMVLSYVMKLAEFHSKVPVKDAVITVPPFLGQAERKGLLQAAQLAGVNVLSLINEHSGAALQYGIDKDFSNGSRNVIFYDMGASSTYAALVYFSAYNAKEYGKTVSVNQFQVKDVRWNPKLGGQAMELRLVEYFADEFNKKVGNGVDVRKTPKAMAKLKKQVKRTKEILSANTVAPISVESLYDDIDFRSTITRSSFEELCKDLWEESIIPVKEVLEHSGLKVDDVYAVELIGGATRVPKLQAKLQEFIGRSDLDRHLDADEAIVLGASLHAANLSDGIKLNRKLGMVDGSMYGLKMSLEGLDLLKDESTTQLLVPRLKKVPSKVFRSVIHDRDFEVSLSYEMADLLPPGVTSLTFARYSVSGLTDASEKYMSRNLSSPIKTNLHFSLSSSGVLSLDRAEAVIEISEWVEVPKKNVTAESAPSAPLNSSAESGPSNVSQETAGDLHVDGGINDTVNSSISDQGSADLGTEKKLKKRTFRIPLKINDKTVGPGVSPSKDALAESRHKLEALDRKDAERRKTAELKNNLEGYIYVTREKLESSEVEFKEVSSSEELKSFIEKLDEVQDWLYTDGEDASAAQFQERQDFLKAIGDPIFFRHKELTARPVAAEQARRYLTGLQEILKGWETKKSWLPRERIDEVLKESEQFKTWLDDKEAEQRKVSSAAPAFTSEEVLKGVSNLQDKVASIERIPKPKPKIEKPAKNETDATKENVNGTSSSTEDTSPESDQTKSEPDDSREDSNTEAHDEL